jgi:hypothetical protein
MKPKEKVLLVLSFVVSKKLVLLAVGWIQILFQAKAMLGALKASGYKICFKGNTGL